VILAKRIGTQRSYVANLRRSYAGRRGHRLPVSLLPLPFFRLLRCPARFCRICSRRRGSPLSIRHRACGRTDVRTDGRTRVRSAGEAMLMAALAGRREMRVDLYSTLMVPTDHPRAGHASRGPCRTTDLPTDHRRRLRRRRTSSASCRTVPGRADTRRAIGRRRDRSFVVEGEQRWGTLPQSVPSPLRVASLSDPPIPSCLVKTSPLAGRSLLRDHFALHFLPVVFPALLVAMAFPMQ
jgi:hypothetical protein